MFKYFLCDLQVHLGEMKEKPYWLKQGVSIRAMQYYPPPN